MGRKFQRRLVATVHVTQDENGAILRVELLRGSGNATYDELVLAQTNLLRRVKIGAPPQGRETVWVFETDCAQVPLHKFVDSRIRLKAIY